MDIFGVHFDKNILETLYTDKNLNIKSLAKHLQIHT